MPRFTRMKTIFLQGVIWLCLLNLGLVLCAIEPGYLDFDNLPDTNFSCVGKVIGGYYADLETNCQMFHVCTIGQLDEPMDIRFLCLNGTVFDQETRVCERVDEVDCSKSEKFYFLNLELYGNTAPPILEESEETEAPIISSTTSTTTTTQRPTTTTRATRATFYTTPAPTLPTTTHSAPKVITSNQFPINSGPDIRFNPAEINIRLTPGSPPIIKSPTIKSPSVSYQQQAFNGGDARITVTTHTAVYKDDKIGTSQKSAVNLSPSTQKPKSVVSYGLTHSNNQQMYHHKPQFDYNFQQTENSDIDYHTDLPSGEYAYNDDHIYDQMNFESSNKKPKTQIYVSSTTKRPNHNQPSFVSSTAFPPALKQQHYNYQRTDKPPNLQLPVPLFPTLSPLTFSSPAPFTLTRHFEQKRSNDHQQRPRIIVSASASVSDASGRRLNYSLGTIGTSHLIPKAPHTYDEYKEDDVGLDPFYHDVPKVKSRQRRDLTHLKSDLTPLESNLTPLKSDLTPPKTDLTPLKPDLTPLESDLKAVEPTEKNIDEENSAQEDLSEGIETTTHWTPPEYVDDNYEPLTYNVSDITEQNKTEIDTSKQNEKLVKPNITETPHVKIPDVKIPDVKTPDVKTLHVETPDVETPEVEYEYYYEYIDDNYEPSMYNETKNTTDMLSTTENATEASIKTTEYTPIEVTVTEPNQDLMVSDATTRTPEELEVRLGGVTVEENTTNAILMERRSDIMEDYVSTTTDNIVSTTENNYETTTQEITTLTTEENVQNSNEDTTNFSTTNINTANVNTTYVGTNYVDTINVETTLDVESTTETMSTTTAAENITDITDSTLAAMDSTESPTHFVESSTMLGESTTISAETTTVSIEGTTISTESTIIPHESTITSNEEITSTISTFTADNVQLTTDNPTTEFIPETTTFSTTPINRYSFLKPRESSFKRNSKTRPTPRHRFSSPSIHISPSVLKLGPKKANPNMDSISEESISEESISKESLSNESSLKEFLPKESLPKESLPKESLPKGSLLKVSLPKESLPKVSLSKETLSEESLSKEQSHRIRTNNIISDSQHILTTVSYEDVVTEAPLSKSANPTEPKSTKGSSMPTTPIIKTLFIPRRFTYDVTRSFNCFGKELNQFHEDPRDCRLFHYCTPGYTKTQVLDMKYVCDYGTYFDSDKLICTKIKPQRCKMSGKEV